MATQRTSPRTAGVRTPPRAAGVLSRESGHEQVVFCHEPRSGLRAIIAIYSTALGPALGGTRFYPYACEEDALADVLELSKGMAYKNALAGLDLGGGKAVIIGDPERDKSEMLLRAFGRFVQSLAGRYITACDIGTFSADMDVVARESSYVTGRSTELGGAGDSAVLTAHGVLLGMRAAGEQVWGRWGAPWQRRIGIQGVGKVGFRLARTLAEEGATVIVHDVDQRALDRARAEIPGVQIAPDLDALLTADLDVFAPCAMGGVLDERTVSRLSARVVCGAANNQLADETVAKLLDDRGILYAPDYVVNAGGVIQVADEIGGFDLVRATKRADRIYDVTREIFRRGAADRVRPDVAAARIAEARMADLAAVRTVHLPRTA
ncbi:valine dehydrogenase [Actinoplanes sp. NBRC 14428]|nr:valine dehydrogenase [Actinoplanes sp. NBRC 14428]